MNGAGAIFPTPLNVRWRSGRPFIEWCDFRDLAFTDPFFIHTFFRLTEMFPETRTWETGIEELLELASDEGGLDPSGFIFHMSRCGSTLVSRLLGASGRFLSLGEPDAMLGMLEFPASVTVEESREWVRALILALGRPRRHTEIGYVIKFTSFHLFHLPLIRTAFPGTPWMFVFRDPISVMRSVLGSPTGFMRMQATPSEAARYLGLPPAAIAALPREEYLARFLARMLRFVLTHCSEAEIDRVRFVNYEWLPEAIWNEVSPFLGVSLSMKEKAAMRQLSLAYSKDPTGGRRFQPTAVEDSDVSDKLQRVADRWLTEPFQEVQAIAWKLRGAGPDGAARWVREPES